MLTPKDAWQATLGQFQLQLNRATFDTWLKGSEVLAYEDGEFAIRVRHAYAKEWLEKHLHSQIVKTLGDILQRSVQVNYVIHLTSQPTVSADDGPLFAALKPSAEEPAAMTILADTRAAEPASAVEGSETPRDMAPAVLQFPEWDPRVTDLRHLMSSDRDDASTRFDGLRTFGSFVTGSCNHFAYAAAQAVAQAPGERYNPLVIYGGVGLGKTHLLQAVGYANQTAGRSVMYVTAETFTNDLVEAIRGRTTDEFRERYRSVETLLVDDIQFMAGKTSSEEEFYHTFNAITSQGGQVVIASEQHPRLLEKLDTRVRARLEGGLLADLQPPDQETRLAILKTKAVAQGALLPPDMAQMLSSHETANVQELEGLLTQVLARVALTKERLTIALAEQTLKQSGAQPQPLPRQKRAPNIADLLEATASYHQLSLDDLLGKSRARQVVRARHVAMYLARAETDASFPQIGEAFGGRAHSTALYGYNKIAKELASDEALRREVSAIRRQLELFPPN